MKRNFRSLLYPGGSFNGAACLAALCFSALFTLRAGAPGAEDWFWSLRGTSLEVGVRIPADRYAYPEETMPELVPAAEPVSRPQPRRSRDPLLDEETSHYTGPGEYCWRYNVQDLRFPLRIQVKWQMCQKGTADTPGVCLMPGTAELAVFSSLEELQAGTAGKESPVNELETEGGENPVFLASSRILRRENGYVAPVQFLAFLRGAGEGSAFSFADKGLLMTLLLALLGGLALNLTPCVLPLIPVNLAMIGAGAASGNSRSRRTLRGLLYGAGIAFTYGVLGVAAALTGGTFGSLSSGWFFNLLAGIVFLLLGLAMFDLLHFDLSAMQNRFRLPKAAGLGGVFLMGALSAVLAGACVAPVVAAALMESSRLAASGNYAGLFLPFLVGIGMALPWPFAAAGLSLLPRPGAWMKHVKHLLGVLILLLALYCGVTAVSLLTANLDAERNPGETAGQASSFFTRINEALTESGKTGRPVLLYFGASWCKACRMMEARTFRDPDVKKALDEDFIVVRIYAERPEEPATAELLRAFRVQGLPVSLILEPERL